MLSVSSQETWVYVSSGLDLTTLQGPFAISDVFNGFKGRVSAAFFANNYVYLRKGRHSEFSIYTQRVFTKDKNPVWLFSSREETDLRMSAHPKITHLTSTVTIASEARTFLILIVNQTSYYKLDFEACLRKVRSFVTRARYLCLLLASRSEALFYLGLRR